MKLQVQPSEFGLEESKAKELIKDLSLTLKEREILKEAFLDVSELEVSEENIPTFKELRLKIVKNRTQGIEKWHKTQKAFYLAGGRFVDAIKNKEIAVNQEMEEKLSDAEKHFENLEKERIEKLQKERIEKIEPYVQDVFGLDLGNMPDDVFEAYFASKKKQYEDRIEAEKKAEEERIENERLDKIEKDRRFELAPYAMFVSEQNMTLREMDDAEYSALLKSLIKSKKEYEAEQEEIRKENERLKKEREAEAKRRSERAKDLKGLLIFIRDYDKTISLPEKEYQKEISELKQAAKQHYELESKKEAEHQAQLKKEREAREKLEIAEKARKDAEAKAMEAKKRLEKAPIKEKLNKWVNDFELPETSVNNDVSKEIIDKFEAFKKWSIKQVNNL